MKNVQQHILDELTAILQTVPDFGALVFEDSVMRVIDADDESLPDCFIVIQPGVTDEVERVGKNGLRERTTFNVTLVTRTYAFAPLLRAARLAVKSKLAGRNAGLANCQTAQFLSDTPMPPAPGQVLAAHVLPLQITYVQNY